MRWRPNAVVIAKLDGHVRQRTVGATIEAQDAHVIESRVMRLSAPASSEGHPGRAHQKAPNLMLTRTMLAAGLILSSVLAHAATWNVFTMHDAKALYFFDSDTVVRSGSVVTLWNKQVNNDANPNADGSYSTAFLQSFDCAKRETRILSMVTYDKNREQIRMYRTPGKVTRVAADTGALDYLMSAACLPDFPAAKGASFHPARNNDEYQYASDYFSFLRQRASED